MAPEFKPGSVHGERKNHPGAARKGFQINKIRWEWPNAKGEGLQKLMPHEHIAGMLNAVGNAAQNGHRALEGLLQQGVRSTNFCKLEFPKAWGGKGRQVSPVEEQGESTRTAVVPPRYSTNSARLWFVHGVSKCMS